MSALEEQIQALTTSKENLVSSTLKIQQDLAGQITEATSETDRKLLETLSTELANVQANLSEQSTMADRGLLNTLTTQIGQVREGLSAEALAANEQLLNTVMGEVGALEESFMAAIPKIQSMQEEAMGELRGQISTTQEMFASILPSLNEQNAQTVSMLQAQMDTMREAFSTQLADLSRPQTVSSTVVRSPTLTETTGRTLGEMGGLRESISRDFTDSRWRIRRRDVSREVPMANTGVAVPSTRQTEVYAGLKI
jgi:hypothetical protein